MRLKLLTLVNTSLLAAGAAASSLMLGLQAPAAAGTLIFTSPTTTNSDGGSQLSGQVIFDDSQISSGKLLITLTNNSPDPTDRPSDILTAIFFNGVSSATLNSALIASGSGLYPGNGTNPLANPGDLDSSGLNEWKTPKNFNKIPDNLTFGLGTAGLNVFQGGGGQQFNYGLATLPPDYTGAKSQLKNTSNRFIRNSIQFTLSGLPTNFNLNSINKVRFQYGTDLNKPTNIVVTKETTPSDTIVAAAVTVPEPSSTFALILTSGGLVVSGLLKKATKTSKSRNF